MTPLVNPIVTDEQIKKDIVDHLCWDDRIDASGISVDVENGVATLTGSVPSARTRYIALQDAQAIRGVRKIENQITAVYPGQPSLSDAELQDHAKQALRHYGDIHDEHIQVDISNGIATLTGNVESYWQHTLAEETVRNLQGIVDVKNDLSVVPSAEVSDETIATNIERALERSAYLNAEEVIVKVENGVVTLAGTLPSWMAYRSACEAVVYTIGVKQLVNNLSVVPAKQ